MSSTIIWLTAAIASLSQCDDRMSAPAAARPGAQAVVAEQPLSAERLAPERHRGKVELIMFFRSSCASCRGFLREHAVIAGAYRDRGLLTSSVNLDTSGPVGLDVRGPVSYIYDRGGRLRFVQHGTGPEVINDQLAAIRILLSEPPGQ